MDTEAEVIADLAVEARAMRDPVIVQAPGGRAILFRPTELTREDVTDPDRAVEKPGHIRQAVTVQTVDSLTDYVNAFRTASTRMFADIANNKIVAVIDYHAESDDQASGGADHLFHRATLSLPFSEEWRVWTAISGRMVSQLEYARFLEENAADIVAPSGADLLEVVRDLHAVRKVNFKNAVRVATDHENFEYSEEVNTVTRKGSVEVPTRFLLRLPVYFGGATTDLYANLRWKLDDGALTLGVVLHRAEHVRQAVFRQIVLDAATRTERPAVFGAI